ncbi:solute carrier family 25 member 35 isoform X1 [Bombyx mori]|uniref:Solute carrier family 25 member 35 n=2 Tax=Bombyx mori TaxID=7091 RepID=A0A8R2QZM2_BOMMO|nr:solute carrier family 25 member 35 isoform X1 [Bombyx mori]
MDFLVGGVAGVGAGFFSNPFDVVKTRMQLQGELRARGQHAVYYKNIPHAMYTIVKHDGIIALQKGLVPALWFQLVVNGVRLGIYQQADNHGLLRDKQNNTKFLNSLLFGCISGMSGAFFGSPLQLVKTQLMSYSSDKIAVGTQHAHNGMFFALSKIYKKNGLSGLWRGAHGMMMRNSIGSAAQISSYAVCKEWMDNNNMFQQSKYLSAFVASNIGALVKTVWLTPMDVIMTRLYNQNVDASGNGVLYKGIIDCAQKITKTEGIPAFYKGMGPSYLRQAPHTVLLLVFWDILKDLQKKITNESNIIKNEKRLKS